MPKTTKEFNEEEVEETVEEEAVEETTVEAEGEESTEESTETTEETTEEETVEEEASEEEIEEAVSEAAEEVKNLVTETVTKAVETAVKQQLKKEQAKANALKTNKQKEVMGTEKDQSTHMIKLYESRYRKQARLHEVNEEQAEVMLNWFKALVYDQKHKVDEISKSFPKYKIQAIRTDVDASGGFLAPEIWLDVFFDYNYDNAVVGPRSRNIPLTKGKKFYLNQLAGRPFGGWGGQLQQKTTSTLEFSQEYLEPKKLSMIIPVSMEALEDATPEMLPLITQEMAKALMDQKEEAFVVGNGTTQPKGLSTYSLPTVNAGGSVGYQNLLSTYMKLPQSYRQNAVWLGHQLALTKIFGIEDNQNRPIFTVDGQKDPITGNPIQTILGRPVYEVNHLPKNTVLFVDLSYYVIGSRNGMSMRLSDQATIGDINAFADNATFVLMEERLDAKLADLRAGVKLTNLGA